MGKTARDRVLSKAEELNRKYVATFTSPDGQAVLEDLIKIFAPDKIIGKNEYDTLMRAAQSDPIRYIQRRLIDGLERKPS